jgi:SAM-dependent methyltransferase
MQDGVVNKSFKVLQFSNDPVFDASWFEKFEVSIYGGENHLDLQSLARDDASYSLVIANHVLEHIPDDRAALKEIIRVTKNDGIVFLSVPTTFSLEKTDDWGYPKEELHGHYRHYGKNIVELFKEVDPNIEWACVQAQDPVTFGKDEVYLLSKSKSNIESIKLSSQRPAKKP